MLQEIPPDWIRHADLFFEDHDSGELLEDLETALLLDKFLVLRVRGPLRMTLIPPNDSLIGASPARAFPTPMLRERTAKNVLESMEISSMMRDIMPMKCVVFPSIKDAATPVYAAFRTTSPFRPLRE